MKRVLRALPGRFAVARLAPEATWPLWAQDSRELLCLTRTVDETSIVCDEVLVPDGVRCERGFVAFVVHGPIDFAVTGLLADLAAPLAEAGISLFAISTFDTDYLLVREHDAARAIASWQASGSEID